MQKMAFELTVQELTTSLYKLIPSFAFGDSNIRKVYRPNQELLAGRWQCIRLDLKNHRNQSFETGSGTYGEKQLSDWKWGKK